ncbi:MAG: proteasome accessory factor PafA2 family protein [Planctomycetota bacterium]|nr:proteasome accessory factor PafA2 family protein [Planctomycetota bacterium]
MNNAGYGCHENYLIKRISDYDFRRKLAPALLPFLVTRQLYTGAGKLGIEKPEDVFSETWLNSHRFWKGLKQLKGLFNTKDNSTYQLSQRADFMESVIGLQTTYNRPIVNTRDEPHADPEKYIRLHLICGDANMSEVSNYLKVGTTALVLDAIEDGIVHPYELENPVAAFKDISKNPPHKAVVRIKSNTLLSPFVIQRDYLNACRKYQGRDEVTDDVLKRWEYVLDILDTNPMELKHWLDWVAKKYLIDTYAEKNKLTLSAPELHTIDLRYHDINPETGLYYQLQKSGFMERIVDGESVSYAVSNPPRDTRAFLRANYLKCDNAMDADWSEVKLRCPGRPKIIKLPDPLIPYSNYKISVKRG